MSSNTSKPRIVLLLLIIAVVGGVWLLIQMDSKPRINPKSPKPRIKPPTPPIKPPTPPIKQPTITDVLPDAVATIQQKLIITQILFIPWQIQVPFIKINQQF